MVTCKYCNNLCIKYGKQKNNQQRYRCKKCHKTQQFAYTKQAYGKIDINRWIAQLVIEGCGIRSIARLLRLSVNTVLKRIMQVASSIKKPMVQLR